MNNSLKAGIISGLISGFVYGIIYDIFANIGVSLGFWGMWWHPIVTNNIVANILLGSFWGIILGIIYSKVYDIIPKIGIWKGLIYGLFLWVIVTIRIETYLIPYGLILYAAGDIFAGFFGSISRGLLIGFLYEFLTSRYYPTKEKLKIKTYDMASGILPGVIAGICGGMAASVFAVMGHVTGYWGITTTSGQLISTIEFWWNQVGTHILINMIWGTVFGALFAKVYNLVPGKKVKKGLYYGLIMFLITTFLSTTWFICWEAYHNFWEMALMDFLGLSIGGANAIVYGLVLGLLYRKPTK